MSAARRFAALVLAALVSLCVGDAAQERIVPLGLDAYMPLPEDNPLTPEKIALGWRLFFDRRLSRDGTTACVSCHGPDRAFTDGRRVAVGVESREGTRNTPTLINRGYGRSHFWDGRAPSLEAQVLEPIVNPKELDLPIEEAVGRLEDAREYRDRFQSVFGRAVNADDLARVLASYVRSIRAGNSPLDRYMNGERDALSPQARQGLDLFRGKGNCSACHVGPTLTDEQFHNTGVAWKNPSTSSGQAGAFQDLGRFVVTGNEADRGAFKTPTLREIARTAPYMHDGSIPTLEDVIDFYDRGGNPNPNLDRELRPIGLSPGEKAALVALLRALTGTVVEGVSPN